MIRWTLAVLALTFWGTGLLLVVLDVNAVGGVLLSGLGAILAMVAGSAFGVRAAQADGHRTSAQAVQETLRDITAVAEVPDRCCRHLDPLCARFGCPMDPSWTGDRR